QVRGRSLIAVLTDVLDPIASADLVAHGLRLGARHRVLVVALTDPEVAEAVARPITRSGDAYLWAAAEELMAARSRAFETLQRGGGGCLQSEAGRLSRALVERYLELKERGLICPGRDQRAAASCTAGSGSRCRLRPSLRRVPPRG